MNKYTFKKNIDDYIINSDLNSRLYQVLLHFNDTQIETLYKKRNLQFNLM